jgi:hypothetical protein
MLDTWFRLEALGNVKEVDENRTLAVITFKRDEGEELLRPPLLPTSTDIAGA